MPELKAPNTRIKLYALVNKQNQLVIIENKPIIVAYTPENGPMMNKFLEVNRENGDLDGCRVVVLEEVSHD